MSDTQVFQYDVFNNTTRTLNFSVTGNINLNGAQQGFTIVPVAWMSVDHGDAPFALALNHNATGSLDFQVQDISTTATGAFILEFDGTQLTNFPGIAFYGNAGDITGNNTNPLKTSNGFIFPMLYMNQLFDGSPLAVLMLVEALGASSNVATPYSVS